MEIIVCKRGSGTAVPEEPHQVIRAIVPSLDLKHPIKRVDAEMIGDNNTLSVVITVDDVEKPELRKLAGSAAGLTPALIIDVNPENKQDEEESRGVKDCNDAELEVNGL